jgi:monoamine oxidase
LKIGTQSFSRGLAALLPSNSILFNNPVTAIKDSGTSITVSTKNSTTYTAKRVVVSLPTTLYKTIQFSPALPPSKIKLAERTIHGHTSKVFLSYSTPWWRTLGSCGLTQSLRGLVAVTRDTSNDKAGHFSLLCFLVGQPGRKWSLLSPEERKDAVVKHIEDVYSPLLMKAGKRREVVQPKGYTEQIWSDEEFSMGCPCPAMPPGLMSEVGADVRSSVGKIHFVGTETAFEWRGYMEGAVRSGERGAREVLESFKADLVLGSKL